MTTIQLAAWVLLVTPQLLAASEGAGPPTRADVERSMGLRSVGDLVRGQRDVVGFVVTAEQAEDVVLTANELEGESLAEQDARLGMRPDEGFIAGICPHDDHLYAARAYVHLTERIAARRVLLIGVFHAARLWDLEGRLVFDRFQAWHGPWGPVPVDPLREELLAALDPGSAVVDDTMHCREHSLEAIVPFLQARHPDLSIVPVLVPYLSWEQLDRLSDDLAQALAAAMERRGWKLGRDLALVISSDAVHYGEDFEHAPFGVDASAYERAVARDEELVGSHLRGRLDGEALKELLHRLVDPADVRRYRVPWCGRFSIPFGLETLRKLTLALGEPVPTGHLLRSATSLSEPELPVTAATREAGLGYTAPSNLHHWVGYVAVGYR